jgi:hypothetical protein
VGLDRSVDPEADALEPPERRDDRARKEREEGVLGPGREPTRGEDEVVEEVADHEDGEPEGWEVVVKLRNDEKKKREEGEKGQLEFEVVLIGRGQARGKAYVGDSTHDQEWDCKSGWSKNVIDGVGERHTRDEKRRARNELKCKAQPPNASLMPKINFSHSPDARCTEDK